MAVARRGKGAADSNSFTKASNGTMGNGGEKLRLVDIVPSLFDFSTVRLGTLA